MRLKPHEKVPKFGSEKLILAEHIDNYFCPLDVLVNSKFLYAKEGSRQHIQDHVLNARDLIRILSNAIAVKAYHLHQDIRTSAYSQKSTLSDLQNAGATKKLKPLAGLHPDIYLARHLFTLFQATRKECSLSPQLIAKILFATARPNWSMCGRKITHE
ncbi:uncharacterized protein LAJ45_04910 [Morchella importuna]|uniref:uncharacterized protein n=1 Tax=Morchella importuna TaxID=1174673 RepID=UPI001E8E3895|nr:uncharacterized protein LAJ45_04910 [Morchella importuna]KAH8151208.1 hypothetical protein LAJ45_04910 [Morchella importuna]